MNDEDLRERFAAWARPLHEAVPPPAGVIRRRAQRHAARLGAAGASALAAVGVVAAVVIGACWPPRRGDRQTDPAARHPVRSRRPPRRVTLGTGSRRAIGTWSRSPRTPARPWSRMRPPARRWA